MCKISDLSDKKRVTRMRVATKGKYDDKLLFNSMQANHKAYHNGQRDGFCKRCVLSAGDPQMCLLYHRKNRKGACFRSRSCEILYLRTGKKRSLVR